MGIPELLQCTGLSFHCLPEPTLYQCPVNNREIAISCWHQRKCYQLTWTSACLQILTSIGAASFAWMLVTEPKINCDMSLLSWNLTHLSVKGDMISADVWMVKPQFGISQWIRIHLKSFVITMVWHNVLLQCAVPFCYSSDICTIVQPAHSSSQTSHQFTHSTHLPQLELGFH